MATDLSILNPIVLRKLVQEFTTPENLTLLNSVEKVPMQSRIAQWEIIRGSRNIAQPNVPGAQANVVDRLGRTFASAGMAYVREQKVFSEPTLRWIRTYANSPSDFAKTNAEAQIRRELEDLNRRFDNLAEYYLWRALTGVVNVESEENGVASVVDYQVQTSHKPNVSINWENAVPKQIVQDIRAFIDLIETDARVSPTVAFTSGHVLDLIVDSFAHHGTDPQAANQPVNFSGGRLLSDRMKEEYYTTGQITGFMGLNWKRQDAVYDPTGSSYTTNPTTPAQEQRFLDKNSIILANLEGDTLQLQEGESGDSKAPFGFIGKFTKSWENEDPAGRQVLMDWSFLPTLLRPDNVVYVEDVTQP